MIGAVEFLKLPGSISSVEYPLLTSAAQSLTSYTVKTFSSVKFTEDLYQEIRVPYFAGYSGCNCVRMNGEIYWIVGYRQDTLTQATVTFSLSYNGPSSFYHKGDTMYGIWERTGNVRKCSWLQYAPFSGEEAPYAMTPLPHLRETSSTKRFYVQITATSRNVGIFDNGASAISSAEQDRQTIYYFFADVNISTASDGNALKPSATSEQHYPAITDVVNNIESLGISASTVTDVSISERSPFPMSVDDADTAQPSYTAVASTLTVAGKTMIIVDPSVSSNSMFTVTNITLPGTGALPWISTLEVVDENGATIGTIPYPAREASIVTSTTFADYTGVYTRIDVRMSSGRGRLTTITKPEGKLPWIGSTWEEYRAYAMAYDRQSVANQNSLTAQKGLLNMVDGAVGSITAGALIGGPMGAAVGAIGGISGVLTETGRIAAESNYALKEQRNLEKRTRAQPGTAYAPQYGRNYIIQTCRMAARIQCVTSLGALKDSSWITQYIQYYGYPDDNVYRGLDAAKGYFKGKLISNSDRTGPKFDKTNDAFINGFRYVEV